MPKSKDQKRYESIVRFVDLYGRDYHKWDNKIKLEASNTYRAMSNSFRVKVIELIGLKLNTGFIYFFDK